MDKLSHQGLLIGAMGIIFVISLLAVSFPALSKRIRFLSIPKIVFFIGKHFGTGVILATAFCHLLQDSFEALTSSAVKAHYPGVGERTGLIILGSLLAIFLVEYITTSYVDHLHEDVDDESPEPEPPLSFQATDETTPLLSNSNVSTHSGSHHSRSLSHTHPHDTNHKPSLIRAPAQHYLSSIVTNSPRYSRSNDCFYIINDLSYHLNNGEYHLAGVQGQCVCVCVCPAAREEPSQDPGSRRSKLVVQSPEDAAVRVNRNTSSDDIETQKPLVKRKRQVVGILFLQCGIMIHSLVIGLTLSITSGLNSLFEGLSLGIRIAAITPSSDGNAGSRPSSPSAKNSSSSSASSHSGRSILLPVLTFLFAITTPVGIALGLLVFSSNRGHSDETRILLTQGLMSAISAGMLIYAATVEMMAGDFVFGNLGGHGTGSGHSHGGELADHDGEETETETEEGVSFKRRVLAVGSLLAGVAAMGLMGLGE
ncbi:ZIP zinc transporter-domain-containing protein [Rhodocollybia butyracea]|uniref:ZIP zinc transporter-domain-containing protein n=1 Tax=Rhodocollybia butyracea TaxID=206335 RepID=A0A9P5PYZ9_9AGAR|nr:ZIP zinc transporter-domain-containing protein [Rhodocollybia butyracea]